MLFTLLIKLKNTFQLTKRSIPNLTPIHLVSIQYEGILLSVCFFCYRPIVLLCLFFSNQSGDRSKTFSVLECEFITGREQWQTSLCNNLQSTNSWNYLKNPHWRTGKPSGEKPFEKKGTKCKITSGIGCLKLKHDILNLRPTNKKKRFPKLASPTLISVLDHLSQETMSPPSYAQVSWRFPQFQKYTQLLQIAIKEENHCKSWC